MMRRRMLAALLPAMLATAVVTGCVDTSTAALDQRLSTLVGSPEPDLARRLDMRPARITEENGVRYITFVQNWPDFVMMSFRPINAPTPNSPMLIDRYCAFTFAVRDGVTVGYSFTGDACGWGGRPVIRPA